MFNKIIKNNNKCKACYSPIPLENLSLGFCENCIPKEILKLKKRIWISSVIGMVLFTLSASILNYTSTNNFLFNMNDLQFGRILLSVVCFFIPFGGYVPLDIETYRNQVTDNMYKVDSLSGQKISELRTYKLDSIGLFISTVILMIMSGPFLFIYRIYKFWQLSNYSRKQNLNLY